MSSPQVRGANSGGEINQKKVEEFNRMRIHISFAIQSSPVKFEILLVFLYMKGKIETSRIHEIWDSCLRLVGIFFSWKKCLL